MLKVGIWAVLDDVEKLPSNLCRMHRRVGSELCAQGVVNRRSKVMVGKFNLRGASEGELSLWKMVTKWAMCGEKRRFWRSKVNLIYPNFFLQLLKM